MSSSFSKTGLQNSHGTSWFYPVISYRSRTIVQKFSYMSKSEKGNQTAVINSLGTQLSVLEHVSESSILAFLQNPDVVYHVFMFLSPREIARAERVCKAFKEALNQKNQIVWKKQCEIYVVMNVSAYAVTYKNKFLNSYPKIAYGAREWAECIGDVGQVPSISPKIYEVLKSPSPFWPEKTVEQTCILVLIPATVNGKPLTLNILDQLVKVSRKGDGTSFWYMTQAVRTNFGDIPVEESHWVLITKNVLPESGKPYSSQKQLVEKAGYKVPVLLDVSVAFLLHKLLSGEHLFKDNPKTYTRCQEQIHGNQVVAGNFTPGGLDVHSYYDNNGWNEICIAGSLEF